MSTWMPANCSGLANSGVPAKAPGVEIAACEADSFIVAFAKPRSITFAVLQAPSITLTMMLVGLMSRCTRLCSCTAARPGAPCVSVFKRQLYLKPAGAFNEILERFPLDKLHRVEVILTGSPKVEDRGNIRMTNAGCRSCFPQEPTPR